MKRFFHNGVSETLVELRSHYWVIKGRQRVKAIIRSDRLCKLVERLPFPAPMTAELPEFTLDGENASQTTGIDFCGPVYVKNIQRKKGRCARRILHCLPVLHQE